MQRRALLTLVLLASLAVGARAQFTWSPTAATSAFGTAANWSGGVAPTSDSDLTFGGWTTPPIPATPTITLSASFSANSLTFTGSYPHYYLNTSNSSTLTLGSGGVTVNSGGAGIVDFTYGLSLVLATNQTWAVNAGLSAYGDISGSGSLSKTGVGTLTLGGSGAFSGGANIENGALLLASSSTGVINGSGVVTSVTGGPVGTGTLSLVDYGRLGVTGSSTILHNAINLLTNYGADIDTGSGNLTLAGVISGYDHIHKTGTGSLTLSGANTFSDGIDVNQGSLLLRGSSVITYAYMPYDITSSPVGLGSVNLDAGTTLAPAAGAGKVLLYNPVILYGNATIGTPGSTDELRFETKNGLSSGLRADYFGYTATIAGGVVTLAADPNSGILDTVNIDTYAVNSGAALVFAFQNALPDSGVTAAAGSYVGVADGALETSPGNYDASVGFTTTASALIAKLSPASFAGTFGFDSEDPMSPATYYGSFDFTNFSDSNFAGISTLSSAILDVGANIFAPTSGPNANKLAFSALNGGMLQVKSALLSAHNFNGVVIGRQDGRGDTGSVVLVNSGNNYTGGTSLISGTLIVRSAGALGTGTITAVNATTAPTSSANAPKLTTTHSGFSALGLTIPNALVVNTSYASGTYGLGIGGIDDFTLSGAITGSGIIDKYGSGTLTLTGNGSGFSGKTNLLAGTLRMGNGGTTGSLAGNIATSAGTTLIFNRSDALTYSGVVSGSGAVQKLAAGNLTLSGANTYSGGTTISAGIFTATNSSGSATGSGAVSILSGATLSIGSGGTIGAVSGDITNNGTLIFNRSDALTYAGVISGAGSFTKQGGGKLTFTGLSTYTGTTNLNAGILEILTNNALPTTTALSLSGSATIDVDANQTVASLASASSTTDVAIASTKTLTVSGSSSTTYAGVISDAGNLLKSGTGTLTLTGANTYTGTTTVNGGTLSLLNATGSATGTGAITVGSGGTLLVGNGGTTGFIGGNLANAGTVIVNRSDTTTYSDNVTGAGTFTKLGAGTLNLTGTFSQSGGATITAGTLQIGDGGATGSLTGNITNNASLAFNKSVLVSYNGVVSGSGSLSNLGTGTLLLTGANTYTGTTTVTGGGTLRVGATNTLPVATQLSLGTGSTLDVDFNQTVAGFLGTSGLGATIDLASGITFTVAMPVANTSTNFQGNLAGTGLFAVSGAGGNTVLLTGTIGGGITTSVGSGATLLIGSGGNITGPVTTSGTLNFTSPGSQNLSGVISGTGGLSISAGTTTLSGNNTFSGPTSIAGGKLIVTGTNTGGGSVTIGSGGVLGGNGSFSGPVTINSGGSIAPGNSPGTLSVGATTFAGGGNFAFEINSVTGTPGTQWDLLSVSGALNVTATVGSPFIINLTSLTLSNTAGLVSDFNNTNSYSWKFVQTSGGITGFSAGAFQYNATNFQNSLGIGSFFVSNIGNDLFLNFTPVPEPSTYALMALGLGVIVVLARRRRR